MSLSSLSATTAKGHSASSNQTTSWRWVDREYRTHKQLKFTHQASWWLASLEDPYLKALERAVEKVWGVAPLKIREGMLLPSTLGY
jgi:hypothetical protein